MGNTPSATVPQVTATAEWRAGQLAQLLLEVTTQDVMIKCTLLEPPIRELCEALEKGQDYLHRTLTIQDGMVHLGQPLMMAGLRMETIGKPLLQALKQFY